MKTLHLVLLTVAALGAVSSVSAIRFDFYKLDKPNGAGDFLPVDGFSNSNDRVGNPTLTYVKDGLSVTASAMFGGNAAFAIQDSEAGWTDVKGAGLGVYKSINPIVLSDDNIDVGETLILTFDQVVTLSKIELRSDKHGILNWVDGGTFLLNGVSYGLPKGVGTVHPLGLLTGTVFTFAHSGGISDPTGGPSEDFYLASIDVAVPDSGSTLALLGLGLLGLAGVARRFLK
ncbi:VPDSG-CTERM sorting domain-containing protein [Pelagicoccus sp. NFK12]|uniref:VPDSG-CTERM sorting domain-containing protein n=1 Tax=Pelagicoccus enzymogenes TaxID=2773457 RepID=A0A927F6B3_9BACT|nr:VPDSG-CTERM sorting domain-containing protein [Pelagicoccus enzymogenes]MBD5778481.1 VPDSG-CTERM sorting domain-containing protein [Pelagicoccus enzymogenes]MDQ8197158.1 VPDSG-CTERM sorting domain-containing protein [Pelagicoccus enzymogenes]